MPKPGKIDPVSLIFPAHILGLEGFMNKQYTIPGRLHGGLLHIGSEKVEFLAGDYGAPMMVDHDLEMVKASPPDG